MDTFGDRLKHERQEHGLTIEAVSEAVGLDHDRLLALERNRFDALPEEAVMMASLHRYADCLGVDAELMIADYVQEREAYLSESEGPERESAEQVAPAGSRADSGRRPRFLPWLVALVVAVIALLAVRYCAGPAPAFRDRDAASDESARPPSDGRAEQAPMPDSSPDAGAVKSEPSSAEDPGEVPPAPELAQTRAQPRSAPFPADPAATEPSSTPDAPVAIPAVVDADAGRPPGRPTPATSAPSSLTVADHGVGTAVENRSLVGRGDRFEEGTQVWFWTHVQGGSRGDVIAHVWFLEGEEVARRTLEVGGPSWRTSSAKTILGGVGSAWVVEAQDATGRVLARSEFFSSP